MGNVTECHICNKEISLDRIYQDKGWRIEQRTAKLHHVIPIKYGGRKGDDNTIYLCQDCHSKVHKSISSNAIRMAYKANPYYFSGCVLQLRDIMHEKEQ